MSAFRVGFDFASRPLGDVGNACLEPPNPLLRFGNSCLWAIIDTGFWTRITQDPVSVGNLLLVSKKAVLSLDDDNAFYAVPAGKRSNYLLKAHGRTIPARMSANHP